MVDAMIITLDEAQNLPFCLASLLGWTEQIFVIDCGSTDGTQEIARAMGAQVIEHSWEGYARQKNWGLTNLPFGSPWTLLIDADELITTRLRDQIVAVTARPPEQVPENGFFLNRLTYFLDHPIRHCGYFPSWNLRLLKRGRGRYEDRAVHEHIIIDDPVGYLSEPMVHNDRRGLEQYFAKHNRYSTLEAQSIIKEWSSGAADSVNVPADTRRRRWLKRHVLPHIPLPHWWRFVYMYILRAGILDGRAGLEFCKFISTYDYLLALKLRPLLREARRQARRKSRDAAASHPHVAGRNDGPGCPWADDPRFAKLHCPGARVLITGGSGFIGTNLVDFYLGGGAQVLNLDHSEPRNPRHQAVFQKLDLRDADATARAIREFRPDLFFHLAARTDLDEKQDLGGYSSNITAVHNVLRALEGVNSLRRIVLTSTQLVCELGYVPRNELDYNAHTAYGQSKVATERLIYLWRGAPCPWTMVRPTSIWGPWFGQPYRPFFRAVSKGRFFQPRGVNPLRSFGFVGNCVYQYAALTQAPQEKISGRMFYMSDYQPLHIRQWADAIREELGAPAVREVPAPLLRAVAKVGDLVQQLGMRAPLTSFRLRNMSSDAVVDTQPMRDAVGELPYSLRDGVKITVDWLRSIGELPGGGADAGAPVMAYRSLVDG